MATSKDVVDSRFHILSIALGREQASAHWYTVDFRLGEADLKLAKGERHSCEDVRI